LDEKKVIHREYSSQMMDYLINLSENQICFPKSLYSQTEQNEVDDERSFKKQKTFAMDDSQINIAEDKLSPKMIEYLKGITNNTNSGSDNDLSKFLINLKDI
jgi:hypothetical protein